MRNNPIGRFRRWFDHARRAGSLQPEAMALATVDAQGQPSVRFVLLKQVDQRGFVFFTDARSRKGRELRATQRASLAIYWDTLRKQVRVEGHVAEVSAAEADAYWETRPRPSRFAALSSHQSATLSSRLALVRRWKQLHRHYAAQEIPRPPYWIGFRIVPQRIEFWTHRQHRLHHRELFVRTRRGWSRSLLQP